MLSTTRIPRTASLLGLAMVTAAFTGAGLHSSARSKPTPVLRAPATPIQHLVVIFGENISFDHYFGTYPKALNPQGEPTFTAAAGTPKVDGLTTALLTHNPTRANTLNGRNASNPFRIARSQAATSSQSHNYTLEQLAYNHGRADLFPKYTGNAMTGGIGAFGAPAIVMGYFDGNTTTALWNYAQHFAMSDNSYSDQYGPSTPGALNLIAGQTNGITIVKQLDSTFYVHDGQGGFTLTNDAAPAGDVCSDSSAGESTYEITSSGKNIGDLLNSADVSWGWFEGGFDLTRPNSTGGKGCFRTTTSPLSAYSQADYIPHHEPFQYYASTANPRHLRPSSVAGIGSSHDGANHQYDLHDFFDAVSAGNFPTVSYLKASAFQDGHSGYSDPLDEQTFIVQVMNFLEQRPEWSSTAVVIMYDDSDGWYDHRVATPTNGSFDARADQLDKLGACGVKGRTPQLDGPAGRGPVNGRCGPGTRQPFLVVSPWSKVNYVDHTLITQSSVLRFIEDNWLGGQRLGGGSFDATSGSINGLFDFAAGGHVPALFLDDTLGTRVSTPSSRLPQ
ncbi:MAG TPA: alkaline phosphatase family protein [Gemmatimonadaceae bacterium]|jgi:phospholipase C